MIKLIRKNRSNLLICFAGLAAFLSAQAWSDDSADLMIGPPLKGAWLNSSMPGQGLLIEVITDPAVVFIGWFTYPRASEDPQTGMDAHRWFTIQGNWSGSSVDAGIFETTGGAFLGPMLVDTDRIGSATARFINCNTIEFDYFFDDSGEQGLLTLNRVLGRRRSPGAGQQRHTACRCNQDSYLERWRFHQQQAWAGGTFWRNQSRLACRFGVA